MEAKMKTPKKSQGFKQNPRKSLDQNLTLKKSHAEFPSHKNNPESIKWYNMKNRNISYGMFVFVHSSHHLEWEPFSYLVVIVTTLSWDIQEHIKPVATQVWFYFVRGPTSFTWPGYAGTITNLQIVLNTQIKLPKKILAKIFLPIKIPKSKISNLTKSWSSLSLEIRSTPLVSPICM